MRCRRCGTVQKGHAAVCPLNKIIRKAAEGGDGEYAALMEATGLSRSALYQRIHRLGLAGKMNVTGRGEG